MAELATLPYEIYFDIFDHLDYFELKKLQRMNKFFRFLILSTSCDTIAKMRKGKNEGDLEVWIVNLPPFEAWMEDAVLEMTLTVDFVILGPKSHCGRHLWLQHT